MCGCGATGSKAHGSAVLSGLAGGRCLRGGCKLFRVVRGPEPGDPGSARFCGLGSAHKEPTPQGSGRPGAEPPVRSSLREPEGGLAADAEPSCPPLPGRVRGKHALFTAVSWAPRALLQQAGVRRWGKQLNATQACLCRKPQAHNRRVLWVRRSKGLGDRQTAARPAGLGMTPSAVGRGARRKPVGRKPAALLPA